MHPYLYAAVPITCALLASVASFVWLKPWHKDEHLILGCVLALALGGGVFFLTQFTLFAFVSSHGSFGPVQYLGDSEGAHWLFGWRRTLAGVAFIGMPALFCLDLVILDISLLRKGSRPAMVAVLAWGTLVAGGWLAIFYTGWIPMG